MRGWCLGRARVQGSGLARLPSHLCTQVSGKRAGGGSSLWRSRVRPKFGVPRSDSSLMLDARSGPPIGASGSPPAHAFLRANGPHPKRGRRNPVSQELVRIIYLQRVLVWLYHSEILLARVMAIVGPGPITLA